MIFTVLTEHGPGTIEAPDTLTAALAIDLVGSGLYQGESECGDLIEAEKDHPRGHLENHFHQSPEQLRAGHSPQVLGLALDSFLMGTMRDRANYLTSARAVPLALSQYRIRWHRLHGYPDSCPASRSWEYARQYLTGSASSSAQGLTMLDSPWSKALSREAS